MTKPKGKRGGPRPGSGRPKGFDKEYARLKLREQVFANIDAMVDAQISNARGIKYLVWRDKKTGKFKPVPEDALERLSDAGEVIEVWEEKPNVQAFTDLMNRTIDKPAEQVLLDAQVQVTDVVDRLKAGRERLARLKRRG